MCECVRYSSIYKYDMYSIHTHNKRKWDREREREREKGIHNIYRIYRVILELLSFF